VRRLKYRELYVAVDGGWVVVASMQEAQKLEKKDAKTKSRGREKVRGNQGSSSSNQRKRSHGW
jgi:hypothetical protein